MTVIEALAVGIPVGAIVLFIVNRAQERASMSDRDKAIEIFETREMAPNIDLLMSEIIWGNYYGTQNSRVRKHDSRYDMWIYSFSFSGTPVSITTYEPLNSGERDKIVIEINNQIFLVLSGGCLEEYHHDRMSLSLLEEIFADVRQNRRSSQLEEQRVRDVAEKKKFTFKRN